MGFFDRFKKKDKEVKTDSDAYNKALSQGLEKTRKGFIEKIFDVFSGSSITDDLYDDLEEALIAGDVGVHTALEMVERLRQLEKERKLKNVGELKEAFAEDLAERLSGERGKLNLDSEGLNIILVVGVNGVGKTTSIGKIAHYLKSQGEKVVLAAGDTFRAAASEQLKIWGERVGVDVIAHTEGADPAAVVFDGIKAATSRKASVLLIDTAGRLHNKVNLMNELAKIKRVIDRENPEALKEVLIVLDATTGQNALSQVKVFSEVAGLTGVVLTKLDGTAKGGVILGIHSEYDLPVKFIGVGEGMEDLQVFDAESFVDALFSDLAKAEETEEVEETEEAVEGEESEANHLEDAY